jgi:hypothetical protein
VRSSCLHRDLTTIEDYELLIQRSRLLLFPDYHCTADHCCCTQAIIIVVLAINDKHTLLVKHANIYIDADCSLEEIMIYIKLFKEFCDIFAWSYEEMPGIDPQIVEHDIKTYLDAKPVRK